MKPLVRCSKKQREETPTLLAKALVSLARSITCSPADELIDAIFCRTDSVYYTLPAVQVFSLDNRVLRCGSNVMHPVVAHPPCGPWGKFCGVSHESKAWGRLACELAERHGGVVEQPVGSQLFKKRSAGIVVRIAQGSFGHLAAKATLLYICGKDRAWMQQLLFTQAFNVLGECGLLS